MRHSPRLLHTMNTAKPDKSPTGIGTVRKCALVLLGFGLCQVLSQLLIVTITWLVVGVVDLLLFVLWVVLLARSLRQLGRALGGRAGVWPAAISLCTVLVFVPVLVTGLARLPLFFWWNREALYEAAIKADQGQFAVEKSGHHDFLRLDAPYAGLCQGGRAWVVKNGDRHLVVFVQSALAGDFNGYCYVGDRKPPGLPYRSAPVRGTSGAWFHVILD